jgi:hypothetical protein
MNSVLTPPRPPTTSTKSQPVSESAPPGPRQAPPQQAPAATVWPSDRFALVVWLTGATIIASMLVWDLLVALVSGWGR